jgi:glycosyltransferase involved in cell wall biosynthesis
MIIRENNISVLTPTISVVMPVFNASRFLSEAISSIQRQTYCDFELLILDDGSTDDSLDIAYSLSSVDPRIRVITNDHRGLVATLNHGCDIARGEFIARMDADDIAISDRLERQVSYMREHCDVALLGGAIDAIDSSGRNLFTLRWPCLQEGLNDQLLLDCCMAHTTILIKREAFLQLGGYRATYLHAEDYDLFLRMAERFHIDNLPQVLTCYRLHEAQVSAKNARQQIISAIGAKFGAKYRRAGLSEPNWVGPFVSALDLMSLGVTEQRIASLTETYIHADNARERGWRWSYSPFISHHCDA